MNVSTERIEKFLPVKRLGNLAAVYAAREVEEVDLWAEEGRREVFVTLDVWYLDLLEREIRKWSGTKKIVFDADSDKAMTIGKATEELTQEFISWAEEDQGLVQEFISWAEEDQRKV